MLPVSVADPVLVRVSVREVLPPVATVPNPKVLALKLTTGAVVTPVPVRAMELGDDPALVVNTRESVSIAAILGANLTITVQLLPAATDREPTEQVPPVMEKNVPVVMDMLPVRVAEPTLDIVSVREALAPVLTLP